MMKTTFSLTLMTCFALIRIEAFTTLFQPTSTTCNTFIPYAADAANMCRAHKVKTKFPFITKLNSSKQLDETSSNATLTPLEKIELTDEKIAEMLEVTFIKACLQLATGYVDVLKLFLASASAGYDRSITIPQLIQSVAECQEKANTANRPLTAQEIDLRSGWMILTYLTLEAFDRLDSKSEPKLKELEIPNDFREQYGSIIEQKVRSNLGMEHDGTSETSGAPSDPQEAAIFQYNVKVISLTISNVEEAKDADEKVPTIDEDGVGPPRPKIPGAY